MRKASSIKIGKNIQKIRKSNGYTQEKLAEEIEVSVRYISDIEQDKSKPSYEVLIKICNIFKIGLDQIFCNYINTKENKSMEYSLAGFDKLSKRDKEKFNITLAENGLKGLDKAYENSYDLLLLDVMLPEMDGFTLCKEIRRYSDVPIMFITARTSEADMLNGYALGCDDYIVKPIALPVFYEKVKALIKRSKGLVRHNLLTVGNVSLNPNNGVVVSDGEEVTLTAKEYAILKILLENKNSVVSREKIITAVWHYDTMIDERVLDTHIKNIRKALGENASVLKTVIRRGYKAEDKK